LLGYDLDAERKGYLIPNEDEVALVNFAFDTYLSTGSIATTRDALNGRGYRTKAYDSRRGVSHPGQESNFTSVQYMLRNPAYIGRKEINKSGKMKGREYELVDAVWPGIVQREKFEQVQNMLAVNGCTRHNGARPLRHVYVLSPGLLYCGRCGGTMEGRSGTGHLGVSYFYYACRKKDCGLRVNAAEIEGAVLERLALLARDDRLLAEITAAANQRLQEQAPGPRQA
jgi:hypothetical protein